MSGNSPEKPTFEFVCGGCRKTRRHRGWPFLCSCGVLTDENGAAHSLELHSSTVGCVHRGDVVRSVKCRTCGNRDELVPVLACAVHSECTLRKTGIRPAIQSCLSCQDYKAKESRGLGSTLVAVLFAVVAALHPH